MANSLAKQVQAKVAADDGDSKRAEGKSFFLNIKGPELLNNYVGETERHIGWCSSGPARRPARACR